MNDALSPEQQVAKLLAYYDARQTGDATLCKIFRAQVSDLMEARKDPFYEEMLAEETAMLTAQTAQIDTNRTKCIKVHNLHDLHKRRNRER